MQPEALTVHAAVLIPVLVFHRKNVLSQHSIQVWSRFQKNDKTTEDRQLTLECFRVNLDIESVGLILQSLVLAIVSHIFTSFYIIYVILSLLVNAVYMAFKCILFHKYTTNVYQIRKTFEEKCLKLLDEC